MASWIGVSCSCMLVVLMLSVVSVSSAYEPSGAIRLHGAGRKVGGRMDVKDVEGNAEVQELGRFSIEEHNYRLAAGCCEDGGVGGRLEFARVVAAQRQVVSGIKYYLRVAAVSDEGGDNAGERMFDAVVVVKPWLESRTLLTFAPAAAK